MKVVSAKLNKEPYHSLSKSDITFLFRITPESWTNGIQTVVLAAELFNNSRFDRPVIYSAYSNRINILSRGLTKSEAAKQVLRELGLIGGIAESGFANSLPKNELKKLDEAIQPYLAEFAEMRI
ncbi:MAG: hypothetical protein HRT54_24305 [Colwellia sp.]|nr:hypothetical protein [Colwellia sp.]